MKTDENRQSVLSGNPGLDKVWIIIFLYLCMQTGKSNLVIDQFSVQSSSFVPAGIFAVSFGIKLKNAPNLDQPKRTHRLI